MNENGPTIKGIFVNSHINFLKTLQGEDGLRKLAEKFGRPPVFKNSENVPVSDEVKIIEICVDLISSYALAPNERAIEAGRLHFRNFSKTPLGRIVFSVFKTNFKLLMMQSRYLAGHVFQGAKFCSIDTGSNSVKILLQNNDYPIEHFKGFFSEWMSFSGLSGSVNASAPDPYTYEYDMKWE